MHRFLITALLTSLLGLGVGQAQEESAVETKLREALRNSMIQQRNVEAERARLDAELKALTVQSKQQIDKLKLALSDATKQATDDKTVSDQKLKETTERLTKAEAQVAALAASLDKWKASHVQVTEIARKKEAERAKLEAKNLELNQLVKDRERRNLELYKTAQEILDRYESFSLGRAIAAREPFTGLAKVKLEEQVQGYRDKVADGFVKEGEPARVEPSSAPATTTPPDPATPKAESKTASQ
jgi:small-conductance mechanosensitive channel